MPPYLLAAAAASSRSCSSCATSVGTASASPPAVVISLTRLSRSSPLRAATTTRAPSRPKARAVARPIPLDAPTTTTVCSDTDLVIRHLLGLVVTQEWPPYDRPGSPLTRARGAVPPERA